jgi:hypothetical protein
MVKLDVAECSYYLFAGLIQFSLQDASLSLTSISYASSYKRVLLTFLWPLEHMMILSMKLLCQGKH